MLEVVWVYLGFLVMIRVFESIFVIYVSIFLVLGVFGFFGGGLRFLWMYLKFFCICSRDLGCIEFFLIMVKIF